MTKWIKSQENSEYEFEVLVPLSLFTENFSDEREVERAYDLSQDSDYALEKAEDMLKELFEEIPSDLKLQYVKFVKWDDSPLDIQDAYHKVKLIGNPELIEKFKDHFGV